MEDDDEFGDLYTDVLRPIPTSAPSPAAAVSIPPPKLAALDPPRGDEILNLAGSSPAGFRAALPPPRAQSVDSAAPKDAGDVDWMLGEAPAAVDELDNWDDEDDLYPPSGRAQKDFPPDFVQRAGLEEERDSVAAARVSDPPKGVGDDGDAGGEIDQDPVIPGVSSGPSTIGSLPNGGNVRSSRSDLWDSDSDDDLQIVLNDDEHGRIGGEIGRGMGEEDGEGDLVIVTGEDQLHHPHLQGAEEQEWVEDGAVQIAADGERKEAADGKGSGPAGNLAGARVGYGNHGFHAQHHSMFKYVRPGTTSQVGGPLANSIGSSGPVRPPFGVVPFAGRGRGEWRPPAGGRGLSTLQKGFHPGYGLSAWGGGPSGRGFGNGLDFTLPSYKTVFDVDIDGFEEKPWKHPGVDVSDFFNFGLDEDNWRNYCKQLDQLRLDSTMQGKIGVYESGRSEHHYDPDLPPELAAETGVHDISAENAGLGRVDEGSVDLCGQGTGALSIRPPVPIGRTIQVETGYGERLPSIDTRQPRIRDSDAIIEIVCQDPLGDTSPYNGVFEQPTYDTSREPLKQVDEDKYNDHFNEPQYSKHNYSSKKKEMTSGTAPSTERDVVQPPSESPVECFPLVKSLRSSHHSGSFGTNQGERSTQKSMHRRHPGSNIDHSNDMNQGAMSNKPDWREEENLDTNLTDHRDNSTVGCQNGDKSPAIGDETIREPSPEGDNEREDRLALGDSAELEAEGEDMVSDSRISHGTVDDETLIRSSKKQKTTSLVEQRGVDDIGEGENLQSTYNENSRAKSGGGKEYQKQRDSVEVLQDGRSRRADDTGKYHEEARNFHGKDDRLRDGRQEVEKNRGPSKGIIDPHHPHSHRETDSVSTHPSRGRNEVFERPRDREGSLDVRQRREDDIHGRKVKDVETRRDRGEEAGSRHKNKDRMGDRKDKDEENLKKRVDNGDWKGRDREGASSRKRERSDVSNSRRDVLDDLQAKRRKDEEYSRREKSNKTRDDHNQKTTRSDVVDHRRREDVTRVREKLEDHRSSRHKDDTRPQSEREDRQNNRPSHEDVRKQRQKEDGRSAMKNGRVKEDRPLSRKPSEDTKGLGLGKEHQLRERRQHNEPSRRGDRAGEENNNIQHKGQEETHNVPRNSRNDRSFTKERQRKSTDNQHAYKGSHREDNRKGPEDSDRLFHGPNGKNIDGHIAHRNEKVGTEDRNEQENDLASFDLNQTAASHDDTSEQMESQAPQQNHLSGEAGQDNPVSDDDENNESRRGRSKLERWTSHKERDYGDLAPSSSALGPIVEDPNADVPLEDVAKAEGSNAAETERRAAEDHDRHLETVAKLKRRSERFSLPMPGERENTVGKKAEEAQPAHEAPASTEVKPERPARKRRWISG